MPSILSIAKKQATILTIKASVLFLLILCTFIFAPRVFADTVSSSCVYTITDNMGGFASYIMTSNSHTYSSGNVALGLGNRDSELPYSIDLDDWIGTGLFYIQFYDDVVTPEWRSDEGYFYRNGTNDCSFTPPAPSDTSTHIISFSPAHNSTSTNPVTFDFSAYVNADDIDGLYEIQFILHNIDQNLFLLNTLSPSDIYLIDGVFATTSGEYNFSTTTPIGEGNYTLEASIKQYIGWGWASLANPLSSVNDVQYHSFIVCGVSDPDCHGTVIGNLQQNSYDILSGIAGNSTGTTTATSTLQSCSPISTNASTLFLNTNFDIIKCSLALLTPDSKQLAISLTSLRDDVLKHVPFGYFTRVVSIFNSTTTASLPSFTLEIMTGPSESMNLMTVDTGDILSGGAALLASTTDEIHGATIRDVAEPILLLSIALSIIFTIVADLMGSHKHSGHTQSNNGGKDV